MINYGPDKEKIKLADVKRKTNQLEKILDIASHYPDDISPHVVMGKVLALYKLGKINEAKKIPRKNIEFQKHVVCELIKIIHPKPNNLEEDRVTVGGEDEAYYYWLDQGFLWAATKGKTEFLKQKKE